MVKQRPYDCNHRHIENIRIAITCSTQSDSITAGSVMKHALHTALAWPTPCGELVFTNPCIKITHCDLHCEFALTRCVPQLTCQLWGNTVMGCHMLVRSGHMLLSNGHLGAYEDVNAQGLAF